MTISRVNDVEVDFGDVLQIPQFYVEGGRPPHEVTLAKADGTVSTIYSDGVTGNCIGTFTKTCTITMGRSNYTQDGKYIIFAKNRVRQNKSVIDREEFSVIVYKDVQTKIRFWIGNKLISDQDKIKLPYGVEVTVECVVEGGNMPHQVELKLSNSCKYSSTFNSSLSLYKLILLLFNLAS